MAGRQDGHGDRQGAGVVVNDKGKFASAHDLRRAFGQRWSRLVMPAVLKELMRHEDIGTTMKYYVGQSAEATADAVWAAMGNSLGNTPALPVGDALWSAAKNT